MYKHILLPTDGSKLATKAVKEGLRLAKALGAQVTAVNVVSEYQMVIDEGFVLPNAAVLRKRYEEETGKRSRKILDAVKTDAKAAGVRCRGVTLTSSIPYDAIIRQAKKSKCDLIMMASHGRKGIASILLGSETAKVLTHSTIPVLVVR
jgi:nucleotide-binding universal stress UspA family protein